MYLSNTLCQNAYDIVVYSLNKKRRWLLPSLIDTMDNFKSEKIHEKFNRKFNYHAKKSVEETNCIKKSIELIDSTDEKKDENSTNCHDISCCVLKPLKFKYKNGNRFIVNYKNKNDVCNCQNNKIIEENPKLYFKFEYGYAKRFDRIQRNKNKEKKIVSKNFRFKSRKNVKELISEQLEDINFTQTNEKQKEKPPYMFYILKKKLLSKYSAEEIEYEFLFGKKSFTDKDAIKNVLLEDLMKISSPATVVKSEKSIKSNQRQPLECSICFDNNSCLLRLQCSHSACHKCWIFYLKTSINSFTLTNGSNIKPITCIYPNCETVLGLDFLVSLLKKEKIETYKDSYFKLKLIRSLKYSVCPTTNCSQIIVKNTTITSICKCNYMLCNLCKQESHVPLECKDYAMFKLKFSNYNLKSITEGKFCPKCSRYIEKNGGCDQMRCLCGFKFCWKCSSPFNPQLHKCIKNGLVIYNQDFFEENIEPLIYKFWIEQRSLKANFEVNGMQQIQKSLDVILKMPLYKDFKTYMENIMIDLKLSSVNLEQALSHTLMDVYYLLKQFSAFVERSVFLNHLCKVNGLEQQIPFNLIDKWNSAEFYL